MNPHFFIEPQYREACRELMAQYGYNPFNYAYYFQTVGNIDCRILGKLFLS